MTSNPSKHGGFSVIEALVAATLLVIVATGVVMATTTSMRQSRLADEFRAASFAARQKMEVLLAMPITSIKAESTEFDIRLNETQTGVLSKPIKLEGLHGFLPGEIIIVEREDVLPSELGRDITVPLGQPDGVSLCPLPMDLNGNLNSNDVGPIENIKVLIGIVVRWNSSLGGEQRYELWCVR